jgi:hypothetical protein
VVRSFLCNGEEAESSEVYFTSSDEGDGREWAATNEGGGDTNETKVGGIMHRDRSRDDEFL